MVVTVNLQGGCLPKILCSLKGLVKKRKKLNRIKCKMSLCPLTVKTMLLIVWFSILKDYEGDVSRE